ncbi:GTP-binding protein gtr2 [Sporothrix bragantina]|uniref:GTP-binding protein gtr2 n=1 Tax=Sporothrix bragantina TaxID=671064 RepID=A0ABP0CY59_9PEZI
MPYIRVGGTSADHTYYNESQTVSVIESDFNANGIPSNVQVGPAWFEGFRNFPGTLWIFQVNMWNTTDNAVREAREVLETCRGNLLAFEIGNEPDIAALVGEVKTGTFTETQYVQKWLDLASAISSQVLEGNNYGLDEKNFFQALTFAAHNAYNYSV